MPSNMEKIGYVIVGLFAILVCVVLFMIAYAAGDNDPSERTQNVPNTRVNEDDAYSPPPPMYIPSPGLPGVYIPIR